MPQRGFSADGVAIGEDNTVPELTVSADGWHWHPAGADLDTSPDMLLAGPDVSMAEAKRRAMELFLRHRKPSARMRPARPAINRYRDHWAFGTVLSVVPILFPQ
jgi:hypothetical protein